MLFIDDFTRMDWVFFLKEKSEAFNKFKVFKTLVENETEAKIKCFRSNNGGEFTSKVLMIQQLQKIFYGVYLVETNKDDPTLYIVLSALVFIIII